MQGVTLRYEFDIAKIGNRLTATVTRTPQADPLSKALSEGFLGGMALSLQGADLAAGRGMESAARLFPSGRGRLRLRGLRRALRRLATLQHRISRGHGQPVHALPASRGARTSRRGG